MNNLKSLIEQGVLKFAEQPPNNPISLDFESYTIPLIEHDYPAKTPVMWNAVYEKYAIPTRSIMLVANPENITEILSAFRSDPKYLGGGAGVGFKDVSFDKVDELESIANAIGSINFILKTPDNRLKGYNTDGEGYVQSLEEMFFTKDDSLIHKKVVMLGAGGTANSIAFALAERGVNLIILNRSVSKAQNLAQKVNDFFALPPAEQVLFGSEEMIASEVWGADVIINVSTKGSAGELEKYSALAPAQMPVTPESIALNNQQALKVLRTIRESAIISDIIITNKPTPFLHGAMDAGFQTLGGIPMVINQAVEAFWILHSKQLISMEIDKSEIKHIMTQAATN